MNRFHCFHSSDSGEPIAINVANVVACAPRPDGTRIYCTDGEAYTVSESFAEVVKELNK